MFCTLVGTRRDRQVIDDRIVKCTNALKSSMRPMGLARLSVSGSARGKRPAHACAVLFAAEACHTLGCLQERSSFFYPQWSTHPERTRKKKKKKKRLWGRIRWTGRPFSWPSMCIWSESQSCADLDSHVVFIGMRGAFIHTLKNVHDLFVTQQNLHAKPELQLFKHIRACMHGS